MFDNSESGLMTPDVADAFNEIYENEPEQPEQQPVNRWALRDRLRSRVLWAAVIGCVMTVFSSLGLWEKIGITAEGFSEIVAAIGAVLAAFGVFNDPTNREGF